MIGVLALQGAFERHQHHLEGLGAQVRQIRRPDQLAGIDGLVIPGGESTTMSMLLESSGLLEPLSSVVLSGLPVFGTCAGMILLADEILDGRSDQRSLGAIDIAVRRNGYGRQLQSFEVDLTATWSGRVDGSAPLRWGLSDGPLRAVFIRAPLVDRWGAEVEVAAEVDGHPVLLRHRNVIVAAFHPELTDDDRVHRWFLNSVAREVV